MALIIRSATWTISEDSLIVRNERQQRDVTGALDSGAQTALLGLGQTGLFAGFDLSVDVYETLQGLEILVVKVRYVGFVLKNLCHNVLKSFI
jgi:hypothetical protein